MWRDLKETKFFESPRAHTGLDRIIPISRVVDRQIHKLAFLKARRKYHLALQSDSKSNSDNRTRNSLLCPFPSYPQRGSNNAGPHNRDLQGNLAGSRSKRLHPFDDLHTFDNFAWKRGPVRRPNFRADEKSRYKPKTTCFPSNHEVTTVVMKNWDPLVFVPELAIDKRPGLECLSWKFSSANAFNYRVLVQQWFRKEMEDLPGNFSP